MKIGVRFGHMECRPDAGACGILKETDVNRAYGPFVVSYLLRDGHEVVGCTPNSAVSQFESLSRGVNIANDNNCDMFLSLHVNAGGGEGCEVIYPGASEYTKTIAERICNSISTKCGYKNRGAKADVRGLYEIKHAKMPRLIVEPFFLDCKSDCEKYNPQALGKAIAEGIVGHDIEDKPEQIKPHWGQAPLDFLKDMGFVIHNPGFDEPVTKAMMYNLIAQSRGWKP